MDELMLPSSLFPTLHYGVGKKKTTKRLQPGKQ